MGTLDSSYEIPTSINWARTNITKTGASTSAGCQLSYGGTAARYISWQSPYRTFQVQYRYRRRLAPTNPSFEENTNDLEQWTEYSEWAGMTEDVATVDMGSLNNYMCWWPNEFSWDYDISNYTYWEYQVRVRPFDTKKLTYGNWAEGTLSVSFCPTAEFVSGYMNEEGGLAVNYTTNWPLDGNRVTHGRVSTSSKILYSSSNRVLNLPGTSGAFVLDKDIIGGVDLTGETVTFKTFYFTNSDGASTMYSSVSVEVVSAEEEEATIGTPTIVASENPDGSITVMVIAPSGASSVTSWSLSASYTSTDGVETSLSTTLLSEGDTQTTWILYAPPLDVPITITAFLSVRSRSGLSFIVRASTVITVSSSGSICLTNAEDGSSVEILYNPEWSDSYTPNVEVGDAIAGRTLPPVYIGEGGTRTIKISGYIQTADLLDIQQVLNVPARWIMRAPKGVRREGTITSTSFDCSYDSGMSSVSISMTEGS